MMSAEPVDLKGMFEEIEMIKKRYGIPKGLGSFLTNWKSSWKGKKQISLL